jgi:Fic family protein
MLHFWLAYDHPFVDGNGRTARALFYWSMLSQGYWLSEYISISRILRKAPSRYNRSFLYTESDENDATYFLLFQLSVISRAIADLHEYLDRKTAELSALERRLSSLDLNHRQLSILRTAMKDPDAVYTIQGHQQLHRVVYQTARTDLLDLVDQGLLEKRTKGKGYIFVSPADLPDRLSKLSAVDRQSGQRT